jgi:hypothetical protein
MSSTLHRVVLGPSWRPPETLVLGRFGVEEPYGCPMSGSI